MKKKFIIAFTISLVVFTLLYSNIWKYVLDKQTVAAEPNGPGFEDEDFQTVTKPKIKNEALFLLMGVDAEDISKSKGTRTDTMMLFKVNFDTGKIDLLSIPRDTRVLIKGSEDKINHAHAFGGVPLTMRTVKEFLNLDIDYYVKVDYKAVMKVVDAIGGVEIDVPFRMRYRDDTPGFPLLDINLDKGVQILDGQQAHDFLRYRSGYKEGDLGRIKAQQYFMQEFIKQALKPKNIFKLPTMVETYFEYVETNIPLNVMIKGAGAAKKIDVENMTTNTIPGHNKRINGIDYLIYDREETVKIVSDMFGDYLLD